jgi:hypothetical protein
MYMLRLVLGLDEYVIMESSISHCLYIGPLLMLIFVQMVLISPETKIGIPTATVKTKVTATVVTGLATTLVLTLYNRGNPRGMITSRIKGAIRKRADLGMVATCVANGVTRQQMAVPICGMTGVRL